MEIVTVNITYDCRELEFLFILYNNYNTNRSNINQINKKNSFDALVICGDSMVGPDMNDLYYSIHTTRKKHAFFTTRQYFN